jgi:hypothetical protein
MMSHVITAVERVRRKRHIQEQQDFARALLGNLFATVYIP